MFDFKIMVHDISSHTSTEFVYTDVFIGIGNISIMDNKKSNPYPAMHDLT